ncbi:hypothetical protein GJ496_000004 [Pomphorhynchus laevis]|nr:hypothetical protein GJ496_000004 [Pomphorhynchus laevis]
MHVEFTGGYTHQFVDDEMKEVSPLSTDCVEWVQLDPTSPSPQIILTALCFGDVRCIWVHELAKDNLSIRIRYATNAAAQTNVDFFAKNKAVLHDRMVQSRLYETLRFYKHLKSCGIRGHKGSVVTVNALNDTANYSIDAFVQIFRLHGPILKIVTYSQDSLQDANIQMLTCHAAQSAVDFINNEDTRVMLALNARIRPSMQFVNVICNNYKSRDFTNPTLPFRARGETNSPINLSAGFVLFEDPCKADEHNIVVDTFNPLLSMTLKRVYAVFSSNNRFDRNLVLIDNINLIHIDINIIANLFGCVGPLSRLEIRYKPTPKVLLEYKHPEYVAKAINVLNNFRLFNSYLIVSKCIDGSISMKSCNRENSYKVISQDEMRLPTEFCRPSNILLISNCSVKNAMHLMRNAVDCLGSILLNIREIGKNLIVAEFTDMYNAAIVLCKLHNCQNENLVVKVKFVYNNNDS